MGGLRMRAREPGLPHRDLFGQFGQSNMVGPLGDPALAPHVGYRRGLEYMAATGTLKRLEEPTGSWNPDSDGNCGSAFAIAYARATEREPVIFHRAVGGSAQQEAAAGSAGSWQRDVGTKYTLAVAALHQAIADMDSFGVPWTFRGILWDQGGRDAQEIDAGTPGVTADGYEAEFVDMIAGFRSEVSLPNLPFFVVQLGRPASGDTAGWLAVRNKQAAVAAADQHVHLAFTGAVDFPDQGLHGDDFHYLQRGYNLIGTAVGEYAAGVI